MYEPQSPPSKSFLHLSTQPLQLSTSSSVENVVSHRFEDGRCTMHCAQGVVVRKPLHMHSSWLQPGLHSQLPAYFASGLPFAQQYEGSSAAFSGSAHDPPDNTAELGFPRSVAAGAASAQTTARARAVRIVGPCFARRKLGLRLRRLEEPWSEP